MNRNPILIVSIVLGLSIAGAAQADSPLRAKGIQSEPSIRKKRSASLTVLRNLVKRFADQVEEYRRGAREMLEAKYAGRKKLNLIITRVVLKRSKMTSAFVELMQLRNSRTSSTNTLMMIVTRPDALFRLSELYYERSYEQYLTANREYDDLLEQWTEDSGAPEPTPPDLFSSPPSRRCSVWLPNSPTTVLVDGAYYLWVLPNRTRRG